MFKKEDRTKRTNNGIVDNSNQYCVFKHRNQYNKIIRLQPSKIIRSCQKTQN